VHVDWLSAWQDHPEGCADYGSVLRVDFDTVSGEARVSTMLGEDVTQPLVDDLPSKVSHLRVRAYGGRVEVSGNPSKWGRVEALAGGLTLDQSFGIYNRVLVDLGLPPFTAERWILDGTSAETLRIGARISRLDLATCLVCGSPEGMRAFMDWLSAQRWGRRGHQWGRSHPGYMRAGTVRRVLAVCYDKGLEVGEAAREWARLGSAAESETGYLRRVAEWATANGLLRWELRLGTSWLSGHGRNRWADWHSWEEVEGIMGKVMPFPESPGVACSWKGFEAAFVAAGFTGRRASIRAAQVLAWMQDTDPFSGFSRAGRYTALKDIRDVLGFDLRNPPDIRAIGVRVTREVSIQGLADADLPAWYRRGQRGGSAIPARTDSRQRWREGAWVVRGPDVLSAA
jgi:hypothetical protein